MIILKTILVLIVSNVYAQQIVWNGNTAEKCDFHGIYLKDFPSTKDACAPRCEAHPECTHFAWGPFHHGGNCVLKKGPVSKSDAYTTLYNSCGIKSSLLNRNTVYTKNNKNNYIELEKRKEIEVKKIKIWIPSKK